MFLFTSQPVEYPSIKHLTSILEETTKGVSLNQLANELPLTRNNCEELIFPDVRTFVRHMDETPDEVYDSVMRLWKHLVLINKQSRKLEKKFANYKKTNKMYVINNAQLKAKNNNLKNWLADLEKQLENAQSDKHPAPSPPPLPSVVSNNSDNNLKESAKTKSIKLPDLPMLTDSYATEFDINV